MRKIAICCAQHTANGPPLKKSGECKAVKCSIIHLFEMAKRLLQLVVVLALFLPSLFQQAATQGKSSANGCTNS